MSEEFADTCKHITDDLRVIASNAREMTGFMGAFKQFVDGVYESGRITAERLQKLEEKVKQLENRISEEIDKVNDEIAEERDNR